MKKRELIKWAGEILSGVECHCHKPGSVANHNYCLAGSAQRWLEASTKILEVHARIDSAGSALLESKGERNEWRKQLNERASTTTDKD